MTIYISFNNFTTCEKKNCIQFRNIVIFMKLTLTNIVKVKSQILMTVGRMIISVLHNLRNYFSTFFSSFYVIKKIQNC